MACRAGRRTSRWSGGRSSCPARAPPGSSASRASPPSHWTIRSPAQAAVTLAELAGQPILTAEYGTTTLELWPVDDRPRSSLQVGNLDEWLTEIAGGLAVGVTTEATAQLHGHPGIRFLPLTGAPPVDVHLVWPQRVTHPATAEFVALVTDVVQA